MGTYLPGTRTLGWGPGVQLGLLIFEIFLVNFYLPRVDMEPAHSVSPTSVDGCGFFNSVVVRLPFSLISDASELWWFYILVVILM